MDSFFAGPNVQDSLALADPLAILVLLGAVAAAATLAVTDGITTCLTDVSGRETRNADEVIAAWLDSLRMPHLK